MMMKKNVVIYDKYKELLEKYRDPIKYWPQWCAEEKDENLMQLVSMGAILVQRTSWSNAEKALINLREQNLISLEKILNTDLDKLTELIKVAGFYTTKPRRLVELSKFVVKEYGTFECMKGQEDIESLRQELLSVYGVGPETADTILLFVLEKPTFIVDAYTKRFVTKYSLFEFESDEEVKKIFEENLPRRSEVYWNYHVLKILDQRPLEKCYMKVI